MRRTFPWLVAAALLTGAAAWAQDANPPTGVIPTFTIDQTDIENLAINGVSIRWRPGALQDGWEPSGYNIFRAEAATGPWTKLNSVPIPATEPVGYLDGVPANPASTFYAVTTIETNGFDERESAKSPAAQAACNLAYNPSFEIDWWGSGDPVGWEFGKWGGDGTGKTTTDQNVDGDHSVYIKTGPTARGTAFFNTPPAFFPPTKQGEPYVIGMYGRFLQTHTTWPLALRQAYGTEDPAWNGRPSVIDWYPTNSSGTVSDWDSLPLTSPGGDTPWTWLGNTAGVVPHENSSTTRLGVFWANDGLTILDVSTAYADDARFQRKTVGATGDVWGVIQQSGANPVSARVTAAGKTVFTDPYSGRFVLRDLPTGPIEISIEAAGSKTWTFKCPNYGGFVYFTAGSAGKITLWETLPLRLEGHVKNPDGSPCADAEIELHNPDYGVLSTWTDEDGYYFFEDVGSWSYSTLVVKKDPYPGIAENWAYGLYGLNVRDFQFASGPGIQPKYEAVKTATPPTLDGVVNLDTEWAASQEILLRGSSTRAPLTRAYALWDDNNLYLAYICDEPNLDGLAARADSKDNPKLWVYEDPPGVYDWNADDVVAFWLDPSKTQLRIQGFEQWQVIMNTNQTSPAYADIKWPWSSAADIAGFQFKTHINQVGSFWSAECKIPFAGLAVPGGMAAPNVQAGDSWIFTLERHRHQPLPDGQGYTIDWALLTFVNTLSQFPKGDLNYDHLVTRTDVVTALRIAGGLEDIRTRLPQGDVVVNNQLDIADVLSIIRMLPQ